MTLPGADRPVSTSVLRRTCKGQAHHMYREDVVHHLDQHRLGGLEATSGLADDRPAPLAAREKDPQRCLTFFSTAYHWMIIPPLTAMNITY